MKATLHLIIASILSIAHGSSALNQNVLLSTGPIQGNARDANGILSFKSIPYAQPPVGNLRWRPPQAATSHQAILNATAFGNSCYSNSVPAVPYFTPPSEDCLSLNVWTGAQQASEKRPVMLWIYGGGFQFGSASTPVYDGSHLAAEGRHPR